jgi:predicted amidohydrolase
MRAQAAAHDAAITGSVQIRDGAAVFNRLLWVTPDGSVVHYDKRHLFRMSGEHERYAAGRDRRIITWRGWRVLPLVCYDLRFPVFSRNRRTHTSETAGAAADGTVVSAGGSSVALDYDLVVYVANWPAARQQAWRALLHARAIENLAYCVGVNRTGTDGNGLAFCGGSVVCDFVGGTIGEVAEHTLGSTTVTLDGAALRGHRAAFPAHLDADGFQLTD